MSGSSRRLRLGAYLATLTLVVSVGSINTTAAAEPVGVRAASPGAVIGWGDNSAEQTDVPVAAQSGIVAIAAGQSHSVALTSDGEVLAWGNYGQSGSVVDVPPAAQSGVVDIAAAANVTVACTSDGSVIAWGDGSFGQLDVPASARSGVVAVATGGPHVVALKSDGSVVAWGGTDPSRLQPPAAADAGVTAIAAGTFHSVALKSDGTVLVWGDPVLAEIPVDARTDVVAIAAGAERTLVVKSDGSVRVWGVPGEWPTEVPPAARSGVVAVAAMTNGYNLALKSDGSVVSWDRNLDPYPALPDGARSGVHAIVGGTNHALAIVDPTPRFLDVPAEALATAGTAYSQRLTAFGVPGPTFEIVDGVLPPRLSLDPATGVIAGIPVVAGEFRFTVRASNSVGSAVTTQTLRVAPAAARVVLATSGGGQQAVAEADFAEPLVATVTDRYGNPVSGVVVRFQLSARTPGSAVFEGGATTAESTSSTSGRAVSPALVAGRPGSTTAAAVAADAKPASYGLLVGSAGGGASPVDLAVGLDPPRRVRAGEVVAVPVSLRNLGPGAVDAAAVGLILPAGWRATEVDGGTKIKNGVIFSSLAVQPGEQLTRTVNVRVGRRSGQAGRASLVASVIPGALDTDPANNLVQTDVRVR